MLKDIVLKNRSYRGYDENRQVSKEELMDMVDHARLSASSVNAQPLVYALAYEKDVVDRIQPLTKWAKALDIELPHPGEYPTAFIIICQNKKLSANTDAYLRDVGIVAQTILLRATEMGLGGCMIGNYNKEEVRKELQLSDDFYPHLILAIGKPKETVILTEANGNDVRYYRDEEDRHYVPKRALEDIIIDL